MPVLLPLLVLVLLLYPMYYIERSTVIIPSLSTVAPPMLAGAGYGSREYLVHRGFGIDPGLAWCMAHILCPTAVQRGLTSSGWDVTII